MKKLLDIDWKDRNENFKLLDFQSVKVLSLSLGSQWKVKEFQKLEGDWTFETYTQGVVFANLVADLSEQINHHADILIAYKRVHLTIWTHTINGLSHADFVLATKIEQLAL